VSASADPTKRFSDRVEHYVRARPGYPREVLDVLAEGLGLTRDWVVADVGSGTGISTGLFLEGGHRVFAVEPNAEMRAAAEARLGGRAGFTSVDGTAEATGLADRSVDLVVCAQAFHWFDAAAARREFLRILRPGGGVALIWNTRHMDTTPFLRAYEALLQEYGTDYREVGHRAVEGLRVAALFGEGAWLRRTLPNEQRLDLEGLRGRLLSSSYVPAAGHPRQAPMVAALERLFEQHARDGVVRFGYDTEIYLGRLDGRPPAQGASR
jgi:SAM-dependent methyltransferase